MKKIFLALALSLLFVAGTATAQLKQVDEVKKELETTNKDTIAWAHGGVFNFGVNEGFLHNWPAGGEIASLNINGIFSGHLDRLHHRDIWSNNLDLNYGLNYAYSQAFIPHKTDDRIDFTSKYGIRLDSSKHYYFTGLFNFKSQFTKGYNYTLPNWDSASTSKFLSPAYFTTAVGGEYREGSDISLFLSPLAARLTLASKYYTDMSPQGEFGVPYNKTSYFQLGAYFSGRYVAQIKKNMVFKTRLDLYSDYLAKDTKDSTGKVIKKDGPGNISMLFDNLFSYKISKYFNITVGLTLIYDNNIPYVGTVENSAGQTVPNGQPGSGLGWLQVKQIFTFAMEYKF